MNKKSLWFALLLVPLDPFTVHSTTTTVIATPALISGNLITVQGSSSLNIHWGHVWAKTNINVLDLNVLTVAPTSLTLKTDNKFYGSGINYGVNIGDEKWLSWQAAGTINVKNGSNINPVFPDINGVAVTDFFNQLLNGAFSGYDATNTYLTGQYASNGVGGVATTVNNGTYLWTPLTSGTHPLGDGAFVQNWSPIAQKVDDFIDITATTTTMSYSFWKSFSQSGHGYYLKPMVIGSNITGFENVSNQTWYVENSLPTLSTANTTTPLTSLGQISMKNQIPASGSTYGMDDLCLFVDTPEGTQTGTHLSYSLNSSDAFFWKGLVYLNANLSTSGGASFPSVWMRNPDEFQQAIADDTVTTATHGRLVPSCYIDGVLLLTGSISRIGNASLYGTLCAVGGYGGSGGPDIYYNSRNGDPGLAFSDVPLPVRLSLLIAD